MDKRGLDSLIKKVRVFKDCEVLCVYPKNLSKQKNSLESYFHFLRLRFSFAVIGHILKATLIQNSGECNGTFAGTLVNVKEVLVNML